MGRVEDQRLTSKACTSVFTLYSSTYIASAMVFSPPTTRIQWESLIICIWIVVIDGLLLLWAIRRPVDRLKFALIFVILAGIPLLLHLAYRTWAALTLEYWVDRNAVTIRWANTPTSHSHHRH